jgi:hypothetical protein
MSNNRFLEIDSSNRNRKQWPLTSSFQIPISQSGRKGQYDALDPVSLSTPLFSWTSNNLDIVNPNNGYISGTILYSITTGSTYPVQNASFPNTFIIQTLTGLKFQQLTNYYIGLIIVNSTLSPAVSRNIINFIYLGKYNDGGGNIYDRAEITISSPFPDSITTANKWIISDPTDVQTDPSYPLIFVPNGRIQFNAYANYLIYNETHRQSRPISGYDPITNMISLNIVGSTSTNSKGPVSTWTNKDNYSIRKENPNIPLLGGTYPIIRGSVTVSGVTYSTTNNTVIIGNGNNIPLSTEKDYYTNQFIRILSLTSQYEFYSPNSNQSLTSLNEIRKITSYSGDGISTDPTKPNIAPYMFTLDKPFNSVPDTRGNGIIEILNFSYDNFNPFSYTGSLVSQQEMVCYEVELLNLILPNQVLSVGEGGRIAFYPYIYVEFSNVSAAGSGLTNIIYSNNPNATKANFRCVHVYIIH